MYTYEASPNGVYVIVLHGLTPSQKEREKK